MKWISDNWFWQNQRNHVSNALFFTKAMTSSHGLFHWQIVSLLRAESLMCEKPFAIGFLRRATWLLHISLKGRLPFPEWMQDAASKRRWNPLLSFPHSSSSWAFNLITLHFETWVLSLPHFPISPTAEHIPFPNISNLWSLIFPLAVSERSIKCSNLEILLMKTNEK